MARHQKRRVASLETRQALLDALDVLPGAAVVARRRTLTDDVLVVRMVEEHSVPVERRMPSFHGFDVEYREVGPVKAGRW